MVNPIYVGLYQRSRVMAALKPLKLVLMYICNQVTIGYCTSPSAVSGWRWSSKCVRRHRMRQWAGRPPITERSCGCSSRCRCSRAASPDVQHGSCSPASTRPSAPQPAPDANAFTAFFRLGITIMLTATTWSRARATEARGSIPPICVTASGKSLRRPRF